VVSGSYLDPLSVILKGLFVVPNLTDRFLGGALQYASITSSHNLASSYDTNIIPFSMLYEVAALNFILKERNA
jgi:hypothetical protein